MDTTFARFESARLLSHGYLARTCLRRKAWTICESQRSSECYQRQMAWCRWPDSQKSYTAVEKAFSSCGKAEWRTYSAHFLLISWLIRITVTFWCSLRTTNNLKWRTACKHCFMTCNTISLVSRLIWKRIRWKFIDIFEDVCSLHTCFSAFSFHLLCCIMPCESSGRFFGPPGISQGSVVTPLRRGGIFKYDSVANYCQICQWKKVWKSVNSWWSYGQEFGVLFFDSSVDIKPWSNIYHSL